MPGRDDAATTLRRRRDDATAATTRWHPRSWRAAFYWFGAASSLLYYSFARRAGAAGDLDLSSARHSRIHLVGNVANCFLYADVGAAWEARLPLCVAWWGVVGAAYYFVV